MKLLFVASPVGTLKSGQVGGVGINILNISQEMLRRGHQLKVLAPVGSAIKSLPIEEVAGEFQPSAPNQTFSDPAIIPQNAVLANMWNRTREIQNQYDIVFNFAYDWLPFYLAPFFNRPPLHLINLVSLSSVMDRAIKQVAYLCPGTLGVHTKAQAETYRVPLEFFRILGGAIDIDRYEFCPEPGDSLAWAGRISPEKGLEDAVAVAVALGIKLKIFGYLQNPEYWQQICDRYPNAPLEYMGFLPTENFQAELGKCKALLMTHKWVEALGRVALEALACGVPIISYCRGGPSEIVLDSKTGWLVEPDNLDELIVAIRRIDQIDRHQCRQRAETEYSLPGFGDRLEQWFKDVLY
ncbi:glycosyltransferase family 4 protein [Roseofilum sp. BLCC_M154]|uniref:Glycosyltransferase family 4 protein n=1 Tax=Roseofilum acuticapitatum BLCC-M154 TaxID=3022444 RepID=A0ABT7AR24_9CYAN|nr:glycosyltransferase family 4 protein [Roseofilum acuticapitatum]MDJ1169012.1 glycosyltransferase family 4 protein [Roseofilum acuticapitatum BLCC-M154]